MRASAYVPGIALLQLLAALASCAPERETPAPVSFDDEAASSQPALERQPAIEVSQPGPRTAERVELVPKGLAEFDIRALPPALDDLRDAAKRDIGPANADAELEKLRTELGVRQP